MSQNSYPAIKTPVSDKNNFSTSSSGALNVEQVHAIEQVSAHFGIQDNIFALRIGIGQFPEVSGGLFNVESGPTSTGISVLATKTEASCRVGQGLIAALSTVFGPAQPNNTQIAGLLHAESVFAFGYDGETFGIVSAKGGVLEYRELAVTTGAAGAEDATITVDGIVFTVPLLAGSPQFNAFQIATYLDAADTRYKFTSNGDVVTVLARLPESGGGTFSFTSNTAVAAFSTVTSHQAPVETWVHQDKWDNTDISFNPELGNTYRVELQCSGFTGAAFYMVDPKTETMELVHRIAYADTAVSPIASSPSYRAGWVSRNNGSATSVIISGSEAGMFREGGPNLTVNPQGFCHTQLGVGVLPTNVLAFRNRTTFLGVANRAQIFTLLMTLSTDGQKGAVFEVLRNPTIAPADSLDWDYIDVNSSLMEVASDEVTVLSGEVLACFNVSATGSLLIDIARILGRIAPEDTFLISARVPSGSSADMDASLTWSNNL